ncbi:MAG TPA: hypothetical protein H9906_05375 [Candidatus Paenalcaligenes intestinipullorum]|uniref:Uncharacterized protein n=1 Tax=Candidatus Paenalcaligenes intestinipullorum TaxID=2838718 RepID=A0A9D2U918_9BURK|nr:hypothetical protein [Candidatus Paenalcaligenes intestinipullorum]
MSTTVLSGERSNTKFLATFKTREQAEHYQAELTAQGYTPQQITIIGPNEQRYGRKIEPESRGIFHTALRAHGVLGVAGFIVGLLIWGALYLAQFPAIYSSPVFSLIPFVFIFTALGLMLGGAFTLRPDHQLVIQGIKNAQAAGEWSLIVHSRSSDQSEQLEHWFALNHIEVARSL